MAEGLTLEVATPRGLALSTTCAGVAAPSVEGEFGALPGHIPLLAAVRAGVLRYHIGEQEHRVAVGPGFIEAEPDRVLLLTDAFARPSEVDAQQVRDELRRAEARLDAFPRAHVGTAYEEIQRDIDWARARLSIVDAA